MSPIRNLAVVALLEDVPSHKLVRGQVGTVVETLAPGVYEVEFTDEDGKTYALAAVREQSLIRLHYHPSDAAA